MIRLSPLFSILTAFFLSIMLNACSDDDAAPNRAPLLAGKTWMMVGYEIDGEDGLEAIDECDLDNTTSYFDDGTFHDDMGDVLCDEFDEDTEGTWELKANQSILSIRPAGEPASDWNILELTDTKLRISQYISWLEAEVVIEMAPI